MSSAIFFTNCAEAVTTNTSTSGVSSETGRTSVSGPNIDAIVGGTIGKMFVLTALVVDILWRYFVSLQLVREME